MNYIYIFQSNGFQFLYCDDNIQIFGAEDINFYKIEEDG